MALGTPSDIDTVETPQPAESKPKSVETIMDIRQALEVIRDAYEEHSVYDLISPLLHILARIDSNISSSIIANEIANRLGTAVHLSQSHQDVIIGKNLAELQEYLQAIPEFRLYLILATNENFGNWQERLQEASSTITAVNNSNENLQLKTDYDLATIIKALAATNPANPELTFQAIERMKEPRLVIVPAGLTLDHLRQQLTIDDVEPYVNNLYQPETARSTAAVYLIEAGDLRDMNTQPEAVQNAATENDGNTLTDQELRGVAKEAGLHSDEHVYGMLAAMLKAQDPTLRIDPSTYSVLSNHFTDSLIVACARFDRSYVFCAYGYGYPFNVARVRPAVMAEI